MSDEFDNIPPDPVPEPSPAPAEKHSLRQTVLRMSVEAKFVDEAAFNALLSRVAP